MKLSKEEYMTDLKICELIGMSPQNLRATYKKSDDPKKRLMYEALKIGLEIIEKRKKSVIKIPTD